MIYLILFDLFILKSESDPVTRIKNNYNNHTKRPVQVLMVPFASVGSVLIKIKLFYNQFKVPCSALKHFYST